MPVPVTIAPVQEREVYIVKEASPGVIPASVGVPVPVTAFKPTNKPVWIYDQSMQGSMGDEFGAYQGPLIAGLDLGGHITGDTFGHFVYNLLGDYSATGTASTPTWTAPGGVTAGAGPITVTSGSSAVAGTIIQIDTGIIAENVKVGAGSTATSIVVDPTTPIRFTHTGSITITTVVAPFTHVFALLNGSVGAANGPAQGPTHCITDRQGIASNGAEQYAYTCMTDLIINAHAEKLLDWTGKAVTAARVAASSAVGLTNVSSVNPYPAWRSTAGVGGTVGSSQVKNLAEWEINLTRAVKALNTLQGSQQPYVIARGKQGATGKQVFQPSIDDTALTAMLGNTQPQLQFIANNGLAGANLVQVQVDVLLAAYDVADINDGSELFGFDVTYKAQHTGGSGTGGVTMTGASGGKGAVKITIQNAVPTY